MKETATDRFEQYLSVKSISIRSAESRLGLGNGTLGKIFKKHTPLKELVYNSILDKFNDINPVWFDTGEGEMFKSKDVADQQPGRLSEHISTYGVKDKPEPARAYDLKDKVIENLFEQIESLKKELAEMKAKETKD